MNMNTPALPPVEYILFPSPEVAITAWEVIEITDVRRKVEAILRDRYDWDPSEAIEAHTKFRLVMIEAAKKANAYRGSINAMASKRGLKAPTEIEQLEAWVAALPPGDRMVCHVAMLKVYLAIDITHKIECAKSSDPVQRMTDTLEALKQYALLLYDVQLKQQAETLDRYRADGYEVDSWQLTPNPFGKNDTGPRYEISKQRV